MTNIREEIENLVNENIHKEFDPIDISDVYKAYQAAYEAQQVRIDELELRLSEQLLIIKGFTLECEDMGTTDIITALSRKDTQITALEAEHIILNNIEISHQRERIDLFEKITTLEARCKELTIALESIGLNTNTPKIFHIVAQALSTKSPT